MRRVAILVLASLTLAGCVTSGEEDPTGVFVVRLGADLHVRRARPDEERLVCTRSESGSRRAPTRGRPTVVRKGKTSFVRPPGLATLEPIARGVTYNEWSPDGRTLAFVRTHEYVDRATGLAWPNGDSLHLVKADGTGLRSYGRWFSIKSIAWSPDAQRIALSTVSGIWFVETHHVGRHRVTRPGYVVEDICPTWLDARSIAFHRAPLNALP